MNVRNAACAALIVYTVGHGRRTLGELLSVLRAHQVLCLVDVRRYPGSRRHPQFAKGSLAHALEESGRTYLHLEDLGGHRTPRTDSPHTALREAAFRGYADHMESPAFGQAFARLLDLAAREPTAALCAETRWEECHRRLLSDRLVAGGARVVHVIDEQPGHDHALPPGARWEDGRLLYRAARQQGLGGWVEG